MTKYLIVNSDDFGISEGVNRGILEAHQHGILTSTTAMVNMPAASHLPAAIQAAPSLGIGLHFTLSFGKPVSPPESIPSLVTAEGNFVTTFDGLMEKLTSFEAGDLARELTAQFQHFIDLTGRIPDHLDSHHAVTYFHPAAFEVMLNLAQKHSLPIRWANMADLSFLPTNADGKLSERLQALIEKYGQPRQADHFANLIFNFESMPRLEPLQAGLRTLSEGYTELMVHVGYGNDLAEAYTFQREEELTAITDPSIKDIIQAEGIQLITFADLPT